MQQTNNYNMPNINYNMPQQHKQSFIPSPVITDTYKQPNRNATPMPNEQRRITDSYRYQNKGPPRKALPTIDHGSKSQPCTPGSDQHRLGFFNNETHTPMSLQMSKTSPVENNKLKVNHMKKSVSADHGHDHQKSSKRRQSPRYNEHTPHRPKQPQHSAPQYNHNRQQKEHHSHHRTERERRHSREHKRRHKKKHKPRKRAKERPKLSRAASDRDRKAPSIGAMRHLIERAETFGHSPIPNHTQQRTTNQAPQFPANNAIFDNTKQVRTFEDIDYADEYKEDPIYNNGRYTQEAQYNASMHLPLKNYESSPVNVNVNNMGKMQHKKGISMMSNRDIQIQKLRKEIEDLEALVDAKRAMLGRLEKDKLQKNIERLKPITLLKRLNMFCEYANVKELELIEEILKQPLHM